jgi:hypothetical protein
MTEPRICYCPYCGGVRSQMNLMMVSCPSCSAKEGIFYPKGTDSQGNTLCRQYRRDGSSIQNEKRNYKCVAPAHSLAERIGTIDTSVEWVMIAIGYMKELEEIMDYNSIDGDVKYAKPLDVARLILIQAINASDDAEKYNTPADLVRLSKDILLRIN